MSGSKKHAIYAIGGFCLDPGKRLLADATGKPIPVTSKAFDALVYLAEHAGELVPRSALVEALWPKTVVEENNLTQAISSLRRVLGEGLIVTVPGRGYQLVADVREVGDATPAVQRSAAVGVPANRRSAQRRISGRCAAFAGVGRRSGAVPRLSARAWRLAVAGGLALLAGGYLYVSLYDQGTAVRATSDGIERSTDEHRGIAVRQCVLRPGPGLLLRWIVGGPDESPGAVR